MRHLPLTTSVPKRSSPFSGYGRLPAYAELCIEYRVLESEPLEPDDTQVRPPC
ncbi:hypothetical protein M378DRAFT_165297 [Amanita muscaria Koide BX008]|uniref:Uncharacterized protein n=1 Tax=Amanita muscaria (strain Koide BX008) TaxID=946122 RepID=A0A0C2X123_AMAMK|nr:hypothetical protein M378DRAFT_165297 [Amanita muscaria Koide BX008]